MAQLTKNELEAMRIDRWFKGVQWVVGLGAFCFCFWVAVEAYVKLKDDPPWVKVVMHAVDLVVYLVGPVSMFLITNRWHRNFIRDYSDRLGRIEDLIDPARTTSGLDVDGTDPGIGPTS